MCGVGVMCGVGGDVWRRGGVANAEGGVWPGG